MAAWISHVWAGKNLAGVEWTAPDWTGQPSATNAFYMLISPSVTTPTTSHMALEKNFYFFSLYLVGFFF